MWKAPIKSFWSILDQKTMPFHRFDLWRKPWVSCCGSGTQPKPQLFRTLRPEPGTKSSKRRIFELLFHQLCIEGTRSTVYPMVQSSAISRLYVNYSAKSPVDLVLNPRTQIVFNRKQPITSLPADYYYRPSSGRRCTKVENHSGTGFRS